MSNKTTPPQPRKFFQRFVYRWLARHCGDLTVGEFIGALLDWLTGKRKPRE